MRILKDILYKAGTEEVVGNTGTSVNEICFNSSLVKKGDLFIAIRGSVSDGHEFIEQAIENGASSILCETLPLNRKEGVNYIRVKDSSLALAHICSNYYSNPSSKIKLIGITGTNGKTTIATLLFDLFKYLGYKAGLISTVQNRIGDTVIPSSHTTPDPLQLNQLLSRMEFEECQYCFMEVSSHAVVQNRIAGLSFAGGVFTNISHDHLDYHITFDKYIKAKKGFFDLLPETAFALVNADDRNSKIMLQSTKALKKSYSLRSMSDYRCRVIENSFSGLLLSIDGSEVACKLVGGFNAYNITAIYAAAMLCEAEKLQVLTAVSNLNPVSGRFEYIRSASNIIAIVDYAHTPDALKNVLETVSEIRTGNEKVITVVGCGGNRDTAKRPLMAKIACEMSDKVILTSDNPRSEEPQLIIEQMQKGVPVELRRNVMAIVERKEAIKVACNLAQPGDIILIAGKGHEKYQEIKGIKYPFDDMEVLNESFKMSGV